MSWHLLGVLAVLAVALAAIACGEDNNTSIDADAGCEGGEIVFADDGLEAAVRDAIGQPEGALCLDDIEELTDLDATDYGVVDLDGVQNLASLTALNLEWNLVEDLAPLAGLSSMEILHLPYNDVIDIGPLRGLPSLSMLHIDSNQIVDLGPLVANPDLSAGDYVGVADNPIDAIGQADNINALCDRGVEVAPYCYEGD